MYNYGRRSFPNAKLLNADATFLINIPCLPVDDAVGVEELEGDEDLRGVEPGPFLVEPPGLLKVVEELTSANVIEHQVELVLRLEGVLEPHEERVVVRGDQDRLFRLGVLHLLPADQRLFLDDLHRVDPTRVLFLDLKHLAVAALAQRRLGIGVV
jgi:hypothetical protein